MLRHILPALLLLITTCIPVTATVHTVNDIPNVHSTDRRRHVVDPDQLLTPAMRDSLDVAVAEVWDKTSAELSVVVLDSIEGGDIDTFANDLFTHWGIGKSDNDNGVLYIVAIGNRRAVIRTGYGLEGVLPDVVAGHIIQTSNRRFAAGDVNGGVAEVVGAIGRVLTDPSAADEIRSNLPSDAGDDDGPNLFIRWVQVSIILTVLMLAWFIFILLRSRRLSRYQRYCTLQKYQLSYLVVAFLTLCIGFIAFVPLYVTMRRLRTAPRRCPNCGTQMQRLDEQADNAYLTPAQDAEEQLNSVDYDVWLCPTCGETDILPYVNQSSSYKPCPRCGARACSLTADRILARPTPYHEGRGEKVYTCRNCRTTTSVPYNIAKLPPVVPIVPGGRGGGSGFSGGGFSGGSFGGGSTGGGGASGGW